MTGFLLIGALGVVLLLASVLLGDLLDGVFDALGPDVISGASLAVFLGAFGFGGALLLDATDNGTAAVLGGLATGVVFGAGAAWFTSRLQQGGDTSTVRTGSLAGRDAVVVSEIPDNGYGEVTITAAGHLTKLNARADGALRAGTPVTITAVLSATSVHVARRSPPLVEPTTDAPPKGL